jgi:hypothetical protein
VGNVVILLSEGAINTPKPITLPYNGMVGTVADSFYSFTSGAATSSLTLINTTNSVDISVYTDATFGGFDQNWTCSTPATCTAASAVSAATPIYIGIGNLTLGAGATFTLKTP